MAGPRCRQYSHGLDSGAATSLAVSLGAPTVPGSVLVSYIGFDKNSGSVASPSAGWTVVQGDNSSSVSAAMAVRTADGTSADTCTWTWPSSQRMVAWIAEYENATVHDSDITATTESSVSSIVLSTTVPSGDWVAFACVTQDTWDGWAGGVSWTNGFTTLEESDWIGGVDGIDGGGQMAEASGTGGSTVSTTVTLPGSDQATGIILVLEVDSSSADPVVWAVGDGGADTFDCRMVSKRISGADRLLYLGDVYPDGLPADFTNGYDPVYGGAALTDYRPITYPTSGNYEWPHHAEAGAYDDYWQPYQDAKGLPDTPPENSRYAFTINGWRVIVVNTEENGGVGNGIGSTAEAWLDSELSTANGKAIVYGHRPRYSPGDTDPAQDRGDQADLADMWDLIEGRAVMYLCGHVHLSAVMPEVNGTLPVIAGGGGDGFTQVDDASAIGSATFVNGTDYGALRMVFGSDKITCQFIKAFDGEEIYSFSLYAPPQIRQSRPSAELTVEVQGPGGETYRWSPNAIDPRNRPMGLSFSTEQGEGFHTGSIPLSRDFLADHPDVRLLHSISLIGADGRVAYEGRVAGTPRERGDRDTLTVDCEGWMSHARQRRHTELIVDRDVGQWGEASLALRIAWAGSGFMPVLGPQSPDSGHGFVLSIDELSQAGAAGHIAAAQYFAPASIGKVVVERGSMPTAMVAPNWRYALQSGGDNIELTSPPAVGAQLTALPTSATTEARFFFRHATAHTGTGPWQMNFLPVVHGTHGLTELDRPDGGPPGYAASDIIRYLFGRYAPKIDTSGVQQTSYPIPHAVWRDPVTTHESALEVNKYHLWQLGVFENRTLHYAPPDFSKADWQVRAGQDGCTVATPGDTTESAFNGAAVTYTDFGGQTHRVTPENSADLRDESDWIAANQWGEQAWMEVTVSWQCLEADAVAIGMALLAQQNRAKRPSTIRVGMHIRDRYGDWQPSWMPRVGQTVSITNHPSEEPRLITGTQWNDHQLTITTDDAIPSVEAMIDRTNMQLAAGGIA